MTRKLLLTIGLSSLLLAGVYATVICPKGYQAGFFGCYYVKDLAVPEGYTPQSLTCDNNGDKVLSTTPISFNYTKAFYETVLKGNVSLVNGYVVSYYKDDNGVNHMQYICYKQIAIYPRDNYSIRDYIREHLHEEHQITHGAELLSLYIGVLFVAGYVGRLLGMGIATWIYTILMLTLDKTGLLTVPDFIMTLALSISTVLSIMIALSIYSRMD